MRTLNVKTAEIGQLGVVLWLHTKEDPDPSEWSIGMDATTELVRKYRSNVAKVRSIVLSDGGAPNSAQRSQLVKEPFEGKPNKLTVMTNVLNNPLKRGVATAISWLNPAFKAVPVAQWRDALRHVDLEDHAPTIVAHLQELQQELPRVAALHELAQAVQASSAQPRR